MKPRTKISMGAILLTTLMYLGCETKKPPLMAPPELTFCSCDSATYCLTDEDVINIHVWYASAQHFTNRRH